MDIRLNASGSRSRIERIEAVVLIAGTVSMGLEILAGRIVAPEYGSSIYTWGSIIGVFLTGLSLGYYRGGRRSEASYYGIFRLLLFATVYVSVVIATGESTLSVFELLPLPPRFESLPAIAVLFGPPSYLLGSIVPIATEITAKEETREASGDIFAVSTVGSILGAFLTTFVLIPSLSIRAIGVLFGLMLVAAAVISVYPPDRGSLLPVAFVLLIVVAGLPLGNAVDETRFSGDTVYSTQTEYQRLTVVDEDGVRTLYLDGHPQSATYLNDSRRHHVWSYTKYFHLPLLIQNDTKRVLFIGGGGFTGPKAFVSTYDDVEVDVVEIDPAVIETAKTYFGVNESDRLNIYNQPGRDYLSETQKEYDLIVVDAYRKDKVPFQMTTREFSSLVRSKLTDDGVMLANVIAAPEGEASRFYRSEYRTFDTVFPQTYAFRTSETDRVQNIEIVATKRSDRLSESELRSLSRNRDVGVNLSHEIRGYIHDVDANTSETPVLYDDRAPVSRLLDPAISEKYVVEPSSAS
ncbi:spermidine synthase [Halorutilales archaeon Cl-col2-1]